MTSRRSAQRAREGVRTASGDASSFAALFDTATSQQQWAQTGARLQGTVLRVDQENVVVDIGFKSEGVIPIAEFLSAEGAVTVKRGDRVDVLVECPEDENGRVRLSKRGADGEKVWDEISAACERDEIIEGTLFARVRGGMTVILKGGLKAFLPDDEFEPPPRRALDRLIGQSFQFNVIKFRRKSGTIVVSRRVLLEPQIGCSYPARSNNIVEGDFLNGVVRNVIEYGLFVDLGGIEGLLHVCDLPLERMPPTDFFRVGDELTVRVLKYNPETERVSLGLHDRMSNPGIAVK